jgi:hypothetical protein
VQAQDLDIRQAAITPAALAREAAGEDVFPQPGIEGAQMNWRQ